jgi:hypothetical protein
LTPFFSRFFFVCKMFSVPLVKSFVGDLAVLVPKLRLIKPFCDYFFN